MKELLQTREFVLKIGSMNPICSAGFSNDEYCFFCLRYQPPNQKEYHHEQDCAWLWAAARKEDGALR